MASTPRWTVIAQPQAVALLVMAGAACLVWLGNRPTHSTSTEMAAAVPEQLGLWQGKSVGVEQRALEILETDDVALMEYRLGEEPPVWFAQVAGFGNRAAFHPPELCLVGSHYEILDRQEIDVIANGQTRRVMRLILTQDGQKFESWYWFTADGKITPNYYQQQAWLVLQSIRRQPSSGTLVRISTQIDNPDAAGRRLLAFLTSFDASTAPRQVAQNGL